MSQQAGKIHRKQQQRHQKQRGPERFTCDFEQDFKNIGISLDVDEDGRLVVEKVPQGQWAFVGGWCKVAPYLCPAYKIPTGGTKYS